METSRRNINCPYCYKNISSPHYSRHYNSRKHLENKEKYEKELSKLKDWCKTNEIYKYKNKTLQQFKELKKSYDPTNYSLFNNDKLN